MMFGLYTSLSIPFRRKSYSVDTRQIFLLQRNTDAAMLGRRARRFKQEMLSYDDAFLVRQELICC